MARELRILVPFEVAAVVAVALLPLEQLPIALPLVAIAALSVWIRGRSLAGADARPAGLAIGAIAGLAALIVAVLAGTPLIETIVDRAVQWSSYPIVRGSASNTLVVVVVVIATAAATELALRGWIVERVLELRPRWHAGAVLAGAIGEALIAKGDVLARLGAALFGAGLGWMYIASKRSIVVPVVARIVFSTGAVLLEALRVIG